VIRIEPESCRVVLGTLEELACQELTATKANWLLPKEVLFPNAQDPLLCRVKIRYRSQAYEAAVTLLSEEHFHVQFVEPVGGVAPGQAAVCYRDDQVLGGGWIE
jgi:tRNA-specific 2-thiouridylase